MNRLRQLRWLVVALAALLIAGYAGNWVAAQAAQRHKAEQEAAHTRAELIAKNDRVLQCQTPTGTPNTPPGPHTCYDDTQRRTGEFLIRAAVLVGVETDCRFRRAVAGMPPPDQRRPCTEQTPADVFPGGG